MGYDLPNLPDGWIYKTLEDCARKQSISYGVVQPGAALSEGVPIVRVNNFKDGHIELNDLMKISPEIESKYARTRLSGGEVLITLVGSVGQVAVAPKSLSGFNVARAVAVIHPKEDVNPNWIAICLRSPLSQQLLVSRANTTVQTTINLKDLRVLPLPFPPEEERAQIERFIYTLDDRIALLRETNNTLEAIAQALFKSWFVDFDPVHANAGIQPTSLPPEIQALFPKTFTASAQGLIPEGWSTGTLGDVAEKSRKQLKPEQLSAETLYVGLEHIPRKQLGLDTWSTAEDLASAKSAFERSDILFGKLRPYFHKVVVAPIDGVCSTDILVCKSKQTSYHYFVALHLFSDELISYADRLSNGAKMPRINWKDLAAYEVVIPPNEIAKEFQSLVEPMINRILANVEQAKTLSLLRDTLLPRLISGQLRLPDAEQAIEKCIH